MLIHRRKYARLGAAGAVGLLLAGCEQSNTYVEPPPPKVTVATPSIEQVIDYLEFTGTTVASGYVEVRARVSGELQSMHFESGTVVDAGQRLFVIDPREYEAGLQAVEAELAAGEAQFTRADIEFGRAQRLFEQQAGSEAEVVRWKGEQQIAEASIASAKARIARAELKLEYTQVTAPIRGRVGRNLVDIGNLVGDGEATLLTDITRYAPMFLYFDLNERDMLRLMNTYAAQVETTGTNPDTDPDRDAEIPVLLGLATDAGYPHRGILDFAESGVDPGTGTVKLRGVFANDVKPEPLIPGLFGGCGCRSGADPT